MPVFSDPQTVTIATVGQSLPRTTTDGQSASYTKDDETIKLAISHVATNKGRVRRQARLDVGKIASDPFVANQSRKVNAAFYILLDEPADGVFTNAELLSNLKGLRDWAIDANLTKLIAGES
jgi:hypothetical protein